jgi:hypothetical protein
MSSDLIIMKYPFSEEHFENRKLLRESFRRVTLIAQLSGNLPFHYDSRHDLRFSWNSWPAILFTLRIIFISLVLSAFYMDSDTNTTSTMQASNTEKFCWAIIFTGIGVSSIIISFWTIKYRQNVITYYSELSEAWNRNWTQQIAPETVAASIYKKKQYYTFNDPILENSNSITSLNHYMFSIHFPSILLI